MKTLTVLLCLLLAGCAIGAGMKAAPPPGANVTADRDECRTIAERHATTYRSMTPGEHAASWLHGAGSIAAYAVSFTLGGVVGALGWFLPSDGPSLDRSHAASVYAACLRARGYVVEYEAGR